MRILSKGMFYMRKAISVISILLCLCMLLVGCGEKPQTGSGAGDVSGDIAPDASGVSDVISSDNIDSEISNAEPIDSVVSHNATTTQGGSTVNTTTGANKVYKSYPYDQWPMPTRELKNKDLTVFYWANVDSGRTDLYDNIAKTYGIKWTVVTSDTDYYWDNLAKLVAADKSPDLVLLGNWDFYPRPVTKNLIQPMDDIIDFNDPLWDNVREYHEKLKWKDKSYFAVDGAYINSLFFYNEKMFRDFGVEKTPKDYYLEGNWTWDVFEELANKFVTFNADNSIKTAGYAQGPDAMHVTTGVQIVEYSPTTGYKLNLKDKKLAQYFNMLHRLGQGGTKAWLWPDYWYLAYDKGQVAMMTSEPNALTNPADMSDETLKVTEVVPLPRMDKDSDYYWQIHYRVNHSIPNGAKNPEGAALVIEFFHWSKLGLHPFDILPIEKNAYMKKFNVGGAEKSRLTKERIDWLKQLYTMHDYKTIDMLWQSWQGGYTRIHGEYDVYNGESWASSVAKNYPKVNATIKLNFK